MIISVVSKLSVLRKVTAALAVAQRHLISSGSSYSNATGRSGHLRRAASAGEIQIQKRDWSRVNIVNLENDNKSSPHRRLPRTKPDMSITVGRSNSLAEPKKWVPSTNPGVQHYAD